MWKHKKYKGKFWLRVVKAGKDRAFQIDTGKKKITFESWQQAKKQGWEKI